MSLLKRLGFVLLLVITTLFILYLIAWVPVVDRLARWCDYYPNSLESCKE